MAKIFNRQTGECFLCIGSIEGFRKAWLAGLSDQLLTQHPNMSHLFFDNGLDAVFA
jgi:hypothetical protein